jgi:hypothetical protein
MGASTLGLYSDYKICLFSAPKDLIPLISGGWLKPCNLDLDSLNFVNDSKLSLSNSRQFLQCKLQCKSTPGSQSTFKPSHFPRLQHVDNFRTLSEKITAALSEEHDIALMDFEHSVEHHLDSWVLGNLTDLEAPSILADCMEKYIAASQDAYKSSPEDLSIALLTAFELWIAIDTIAVAQCPLLKQYPPEVYQDGRLLRSLLLSKFDHLRRLEVIEKYLKNRQC